MTGIDTSSAKRPIEGAVSFEPRIALRPRTLDETFDLALAYFRSSARELGRPFAALVGVSSLFVVVLGRALALSTDRSVLLAIWISPLIEQVVTVHAGRHLFRNKAEVGAVLGAVARRLPGLVISSVFASLPLAPMLWTSFEDTTWVGLGILFGVFWPILLATEVYRWEISLLERLSFAEATRRAHALVAYRFGRVLGFVLVSTALRVMISGATCFLSDFLLGFVLQFDHLKSIQGQMIVVGYLAGAPYIALVRMFDYVDARTRREGWDIQVRFNAIAQAAREASDAGYSPQRERERERPRA